MFLQLEFIPLVLGVCMDLYTSQIPTLVCLLDSEAKSSIVEAWHWKENISPQQISFSRPNCSHVKIMNTYSTMWEGSFCSFEASETDYKGKTALSRGAINVWLHKFLQRGKEQRREVSDSRNSVQMGSGTEVAQQQKNLRAQENLAHCWYVVQE